MSNPEPGKDHYSMQEMMERLRDGSGHQDDSRHHRKRRSFQPVIAARQRRRRWVLILGTVVVLLVGGGLVVSMLNSARVKGEVFRQAANNCLAALTKTEVDCDRFSPRGWRHLDCPNIRFKGSGGTLKNAQLEGLRGDLSSVSFFRNEWDVESLQIDKATIEFQIPAAPRRADDDPSVVVSNAAANDGFRLGVSPEPAAISINVFHCDLFEASWPDSYGQPNRIVGAKASGNFSKGELTAAVEGGRFISPTWGELPLKSITIKTTSDGIVLENALLRITDERVARLKGAIKFGRDGASADVQAALEPLQPPVKLTELLHPVWQNRIHAKFVPDKLSFSTAPGGEEEFRGDFSLEGVVIENFPGITVLTKFFKSDIFKKLELRQGTAKFSRTASRLRIFDINLSHPGDSRLTGEVLLFADGRLDGKLRLLLNTPQDNLPGFSGQEDGLDVIEVSLSGTELDPKDNLGEKFPVPPEPAPNPQ